MLKVTLDTNCIVDLEKGRPPASALRSLIAASEKGVAVLRVSAIAASEKTKGGGYPTNFSDFQSLVKGVGLGNAEFLLPIGYWDVTYWDYCLWGAEDMVALEKHIHEILFPAVGFLDTRNPRWRNAKCDVLGMWCHIYHKGDVFVTEDRNFHKVSKKPRLIALGAGQILRPEQLAKQLFI